MWLMQLGEVIFGGVGSGLYGMIMMILVAVFVAGLMIGRTPEYLGKKIEAFEVKMASVAILLPPLVVLVGTAIAVLVEPGKAGIANPGAHGYSEILYAFSSAGNNNGSAFAGLSANTPFYNTALGFAMLISRYWLIVPVLAIAGSFAAKKTVPAGPGHAADAYAALHRAASSAPCCWSARSPSCLRSRSGRSWSTFRCWLQSSEDTRMSDHTATIPAPQPAAPRPMFEPGFVKPAIWEAFKRLAPQAQWKNPVMFVCYIGAIITTGLGVQAVVSTGEAPAGYILHVSLWLWFTVLFANFAEAIAEGRGKAQAAALRSARRDIMAKKLSAPRRGASSARGQGHGAEAWAISCSSRPATPSRSTAKSSRAWRPSTSRRSRANRLP